MTSTVAVTTVVPAAATTTTVPYEMMMMNVRIPDGLVEGSRFQFEAHSKLYTAIVPSGYKGGQTMTVQVSRMYISFVEVKNVLNVCLFYELTYAHVSLCLYLIFRQVPAPVPVATVVDASPVPVVYSEEPVTVHARVVIANDDMGVCRSCRQRFRRDRRDRGTARYFRCRRCRSHTFLRFW